PGVAQHDLDEYRKIAWGDFISNQIAPFGLLTVRLGIGNHEVVGKTPADFLAQFSYWLDAPELRSQRIRYSPQDPTIQTYYHWKEHNVDFIYLDNSGEDGFDDDQMKWFEQVLERSKTDKDVRTIVLGMHRALPNSLACGHSMNGDQNNPSENGTKT